jgi:hypothetical protein
MPVGVGVLEATATGFSIQPTDTTLVAVQGGKRRALSSTALAPTGSGIELSGETKGRT